MSKMYNSFGYNREGSDFHHTGKKSKSNVYSFLRAHVEKNIQNNNYSVVLLNFFIVTA